MTRELRSRAVSGASAARIVVVEDDPEMRFLLQEMLEEDGYEAVGTPDSLSAFMHLMGQGADLLVTDWKMPAVNGLDLLQSVRRCLPDLPVIFITAFADSDLERRAMAGGADSFLAKPFQRDELLDRVRLALAAGRPGREPQGPDGESRERSRPRC